MPRQVALTGGIGSRQVRGRAAARRATAPRSIDADAAGARGGRARVRRAGGRGRRRRSARRSLDRRRGPRPARRVAALVFADDEARRPASTRSCTRSSAPGPPACWIGRARRATPSSSTTSRCWWRTGSGAGVRPRRGRRRAGRRCGSTGSSGSVGWRTPTRGARMAAQAIARGAARRRPTSWSTTPAAGPTWRAQVDALWARAQSTGATYAADVVTSVMSSATATISRITTASPAGTSQRALP